MNREINGVCEFYSETGTEGGHWAFQDENFITKAQSEYGVFGNQTVFDANKQDRKGKTQAETYVLHGDIWDPFPDPLTKDPDYIKSSLFRGERGGDKKADQRLIKKYEFKIHYAVEMMDEEYGKGNWRLTNTNWATTKDGQSVYFPIGGTPKTVPNRPYGLGKGDITKNIVEWEDRLVEIRFSTTLLQESWSYEGLHILEDGDHLTIYAPQNSQEIIWSGEIDLKKFPPFTESASGLWIHSEQKEIDRETWSRYFLRNYPARLLMAEKTEEDLGDHDEV